MLSYNRYDMAEIFLNCYIGLYFQGQMKRHFDSQAAYHHFSKNLVKIGLMLIEILVLRPVTLTQIFKVSRYNTLSGNYFTLIGLQYTSCTECDHDRSRHLLTIQCFIMFYIFQQSYMSALGLIMISKQNNNYQHITGF